MDETGRSVSIFYSYAHEDKKIVEKLINHMGKEYITWYDGMIPPGGDWNKEIEIHLNTADIILLLISAYFKASEYCANIEMVRALEREKEKEAYVIPIILRPVFWKNAPYRHLQHLPTGAVAITKWKNPDEALSDVTRGIYGVIERIVKSEEENDNKIIQRYFNLAAENRRDMLFYVSNMLNVYAKNSDDNVNTIGEKISVLRKKAIYLADLGQFEKALEVYDQVIVGMPADFDRKICAYIYKERGDVHYQLNHLPEAFDDYEEAILARPGFAKAEEQKGIVLRRMKEQIAKMSIRISQQELDDDEATDG